MDKLEFTKLGTYWSLDTTFNPKIDSFLGSSESDLENEISGGSRYIVTAIPLLLSRLFSNKWTVTIKSKRKSIAIKNPRVWYADSVTIPGGSKVEITQFVGDAIVFQTSEGAINQKSYTICLEDLQSISADIIASNRAPVPDDVNLKLIQNGRHGGSQLPAARIKATKLTEVEWSLEMLSCASAYINPLYSIPSWRGQAHSFATPGPELVYPESTLYLVKGELDITRALLNHDHCPAVSHVWPNQSDLKFPTYIQVQEHVAVVIPPSTFK